MLRPRSEHQRHLRQRRKPRRPGIEQHLANLLARQRPARLPGLNHFVSRRAHYGRQLAQLRALAGAVEPFEGNEFPAPRHLRIIAASSKTEGWRRVYLRPHVGPSMFAWGATLEETVRLLSNRTWGMTGSSALSA